MVVVPTLACGLQECIGNLWEHDDFSDFTVLVEDAPFSCHRFILSACSGFFQGLFRSQMKECEDSCAKVEGMTKDIFQIILNSVYRGVDGLTEDNVFDVWAATIQLQFVHLIKECENFVCQKMSMDNCSRIVQMATLFSSKKVTDHSINFISEFFESTEHTKSFLELPFDCFYRIIKNDALKTSSEDLVIKAVLRWVEFKESVIQVNTGSTASNIIGTESDQVCSLSQNENTEKTDQPIAEEDCEETCDIDANGEAKQQSSDRRKHLPELISACRLYLADSLYLKEILTDNELIFSCKTSHNLIVEALMYKLDVKQRHDCWPEAAIHREKSTSKHVVVFASNRTIMAYSLASGSVRRLGNYPTDYLNGPISIIIFDNMLYMHYQQRDSKRILSVYNITDERWTPVCDADFIANGWLAKGENIYCCVEDNRYNSTRLDYVNCMGGKSKKWSTCGSVGQAKNFFMLGFQNDVVYFYIENNVVMAEYKMGSYSHNRSRAVRLVEGVSVNMVSFTSQGQVFILRDNGMLWKVISTEVPVGFEFISQLWDFDLPVYGGVVFHDQLFVFCFEDNRVKSGTYQESLPGLFQKIKMVTVRNESQCLPMVLHNYHY